MSNISVRLNYGSSHDNSSIFIQPLFYLGTNSVQKLFKKYKNPEYNEKLIDDNLQILSINNVISDASDTSDSASVASSASSASSAVASVASVASNSAICNVVASDKHIIELEIHKYNTNNNIEIIYLLNKHTNNIKFMYKNIEFEIKIISIDNTDRLKKINDCKFDLYTSYEIIFNVKHINIFNEFIKTSVHYYNKYYIINKNINEYIDIYITSTSGKYFMYLCKKQKRSMNSIYIPQEQKTNIINDLTDFLKPETKIKYNTLGITYKRTYLLEGIPGTGKTSLITSIASKFNFNIAIVSFTPEMTDIDLISILRSSIDDNKEHYDETTATTSTRKILIIFEDIDCIFKERKANDEMRNCITFSGLLNALDGITTDEIICFITTNYIKHLDSALLRSGRIDYIMHFDYAVKEQIIDIFRNFTNTLDILVYEPIHTKFYDECCKLNIKITISLLQQYLIKYIDKPQQALENIEEMQKIYNASDVSTSAEQSGFYS